MPLETINTHKPTTTVEWQKMFDNAKNHTLKRPRIGGFLMVITHPLPSM